MSNRLSREKSPYLLQCQENPVDWYPWGAEALERAKAEDRPIFLSIGYSSCHWCHVMARESFENPEIAEFLNRHFINVKVDREERPDLDQIYLDAVQTMTGEGGWPLSVFLLPDGRPFLGGTYFPPQSKYGRPGFPEILHEVVECFRHHREDLDFRAGELTEELRHPYEIHPAALQADLLEAASERLLEQFEPWYGGFGGAPKFPPPMPLEFLLRDWWNHREERTRHVVLWTLQKMRQGGIFDQIGGGFHRYAVDLEWQVPHFEKMLADNALLARCYLLAFQLFGKDDFRQVTEETLLWVVREMRSPEGAFYSSLDADSAGQEGLFYLWTPEEVSQVLAPEERKLILSAWGITAEGNFEGKSIPHLPRPLAETAEALGLPLARAQGMLRLARIELYEARNHRIWPHRDEKVITSWNALMLRAFAEASRILNREEYRAIACKNAEFLLTRLTRDDQVLHYFCGGESGVQGFLEDYANLANGLISLYEATFDSHWLEAAARITERMIADFWDGEYFWDSGKANESLVARPLAIFDNATPSGNAVACEVLIRLSHYLGRDDWRELAQTVLRQLAGEASRTPLAFGYLLSVLDLHLHPIGELAILGDPDNPETQALIRAAYEPYMPYKVVGGISKKGPGPILFLREQKTEQPMAILCFHETCGPPLTSADALRAELEKRS